MITFYFSATGNSLAVAKQIGGKLISIPQAIKNNPYEYTDDAIGFVFPTYCCNIPKIVRDFISSASFHADYFFAVATYGNGIGTGGDGNLLNRLDEFAGFQFDYLNSILMVDNFVDAFNIEKEIQKIPSKEIDEHMEKICSDIHLRKQYQKSVGLMGKLMTGVCRPMSKKQDEGKMDARFIVDEACVRCGTCVKICPRKNITLNPNVTFHHHCEGCYGCLHICPKQAIHVKRERGTKRWRNSDVSVKELLDSNNQWN